MKLFGKKEKNAAAPEQATDDLGDMDAGFEEMEGVSAPAAPLSAPSRSLAGASGAGRKNLMVLGALVAIAGLGGAYFWLMGDSQNEPIHVTAQTQPVTPPMPDPAAPAAADPLAPAADPAAAATPPMPDAAAVAPTAPADPFAAPPADPAATASTDPLAAGNVAADPAAANVAADPAAGAAAAVTATDPAAAAAVLGLPPADEASAIAAVTSGTPADTMDGQTLDTPPAAAAPALPNGMPPQPAAAPATAAAPVEAAPAEPAPNWAAPGNAAVPGTTNPAAVATSPNEAELAIVQHADVIDQLSRPAQGDAAATSPATGAPFDPAAVKTPNANAMKTVGEILEQPGVVREIPSGYVTIRKESDAGSIDSRLTAARSALARGNNTAALALFDDLHNDYPKDKRILMGRAVSLHKLGQKDDALAAYEAVLNRDPKNIDALNNMLGLLKAKDPQLAVEKLQELHDAYPQQGDIAAQLGISYGSAGQYDQALRYLEMADSLKPGSGFVLYNKAVLLDKMGRSREAASLYRQILRMAADGDIRETLPLDSIRRRLAALQ